MSLSGVLENTEVLDKAGDGVCRFGEAYGSFPENFIKINHMESSQDFPCPLSPIMGSWETCFWMIKN